jgi:hypothetical protein
MRQRHALSTSGGLGFEVEVREREARERCG